jgi:NAD(P)-dependent dehydrogenase (short-subunit alcohol dehydrogenase family)
LEVKSKADIVAGNKIQMAIQKGDRTMELEGKTAIVTGSARGIGEGIALVLAREGASIVVNSRKKEDCERVVQKIVSMGGKAIAVAADVSKKADVTAMVAETVKQFGAIDILVNNAGIEGHPSLTIDLSEEQWDRVLTVNLKGVFLCCQAVIPQMMKQNRGRIVNIGSTAGLRMTFLGSLEYTVSKHGIAGLNQHLAWELADSNITVNTVCPGGVQTPLMESATTTEYREMVVKRLIPLGRFTTTEEIGEAVSFLASDRAAMITGQMLGVDGGMLTGFGEDMRSVVRSRMADLKAGR